VLETVLKELIALALALFPVALFLVSLIYIDSFKLVSVRSVLIAVGAGFVAAFLSLGANRALMDLLQIPDSSTVSRYVAPVVEESFKTLYLLFLFRKRKIGFMVDAAIYGFGIGAGFAIVENIFVLVWTLPDSNILLSFVRGFGTAIMHGAVTAITAIIIASAIERKRSYQAGAILVGLLCATALHSLYNHFFLPPVVGTLVILAVLPLLIVVVFHLSENGTRKWLGSGLDREVELIELIASSTFSESPTGKYLASLRDYFPAVVVADMLCLLRLRTELAVQAKGQLLMQEAGIVIGPDEDLQSKLNEIDYLEKQIGATGLMALHPLFRYDSRHNWQKQLLTK